MLPQVEASSELSVQPTLAQLAGMAREDPISLAQVTAEVTVVNTFYHARSDKIVEQNKLFVCAFRCPTLQSFVGVLVVSAGTSPLMFAVCSWIISFA